MPYKAVPPKCLLNWNSKRCKPVRIPLRPVRGLHRPSGIQYLGCTFIPRTFFGILDRLFKFRKTRKNKFKGYYNIKFSPSTFWVKSYRHTDISIVVKSNAHIEPINELYRLFKPHSLSRYVCIFCYTDGPVVFRPITVYY